MFLYYAIISELISAKLEQLDFHRITDDLLGTFELHYGVAASHIIERVYGLLLFQNILVFRQVFIY
jgi:hypothetical protein